MSIRWRKTGELLCAAKCEEMDGDTYIDDRLHYELSVIQRVLVPDIRESETGLWHWLHGWCSTSDHPEDVPEGAPRICSVENKTSEEIREKLNLLY